MGKAKGDLLTCDWNPIIGCERYSPGCRLCWYLDGIFPWQQRLGNIPAEVSPSDHHVFQNRMDVSQLRTKKGIVGVVQHGDLFWQRVPDTTINAILDIVDKAATMRADSTKYVLWTKRAERMAQVLSRRYPSGLPSYLAVSVSVENQAAADERLPHLVSLHGVRIIMIEPMLGPVNLEPYLPVEWVVVGSETGKPVNHPIPLDLDWVRPVRDISQRYGIPFFIKQLGNRHDVPIRALDGREWDEFPAGFVK